MHLGHGTRIARPCPEGLAGLQQVLAQDNRTVQQVLAQDNRSVRLRQTNVLAQDNRTLQLNQTLQQLMLNRNTVNVQQI